MSVFDFFKRKAAPEVVIEGPQPARFEPVILFSMSESGEDQLAQWLQAYFGPQLTLGDLTREEAVLRVAPPLDLSLPQQAGQRYLVTYQADFAAMVIPAYELHLRLNVDAEDSVASFRTFASMFFAEYQSFVKTWVRSAFGRDQLVFTRDQLIVHDRDCLRLAIWWLAPEHVIDEARVEQVLKTQGAVPELPKPTEFRHYDKALFTTLSRLSLTREEVARAFASEFGRSPAESNYLQFQVQPNFDKMIAVMQGSNEYRKRQARLAAAQEAKK